ncbi:MAG: DUF1957 domain-containing protein [Abitibacteriaceae bacterium]|nr:DUF1957 domain-containing protein [Abditibacteriaceae bacterium]MBV9866278.1 DUF1957 domain-containing protein [Abditibacteriaceae bacterium]
MSADSTASNIEIIQSDNSTHPIGSFMLVLHAHLPWVLSHGRWPNGVDWLCEATAETYIPLLNVFNRLLNDDIAPRVTLAITPVLCDMLSSMSFMYTFQEYLQFRIDAASRNAREFAAQGLDDYRDIALFWENWYTNIARDFEQTYERDVVGAFRKLQDHGGLEIITSTATHAYLPLLGTDEAIHAQIRLGVDSYKKHFGRQPRGIWLPECAYRPRGEWLPPEAVRAEGTKPVLRKGVDEFLAANQLHYFVIDSHLLHGGKPPGHYLERYDSLRWMHETFADQHVDTPEDGSRSPHEVYLVSSAPGSAAPVACFTQHEPTSTQLWQATGGYACEGVYLDSHKKHFPGGHRLWRVTSPSANLAQKEPYEPLRVGETCEAQANHFVGMVKDALRSYSEQSGQLGIVCCTCDAKLFGPMWFEGTNWFYRTLKKLWQDEEINLSTGSQYIDMLDSAETITLPEGSWGEGGSDLIWLNADTEWIWREIYDCEAIMSRLAREYKDTPNPKLRQILEQCAREVLLMESSDWPFLISTMTAREYAELRCAGHVDMFRRLVGIAEKVAAGEFMSEGERQFLHATQERDKCFSPIPLELWANSLGD